MGRSSAAGNLFITVGGDVTPLKTAMTAGRSVLNEFAGAAIDVQAEVTKAFANMAANAPAAAKQLEQSYSASFAQIRKNAEAVLNAPNGASAADIINATGARQAAAAAEGQAAALRLVANAAIAADTAQQGANAGVRAYAVAAEADAQQAERYAAGLRMQAQSLGLVEAELVAAGGAGQRFSVQQSAMTGGAGNARIAQMELMHIVRGSVDQFAAGASASQVLAMHMGMLGQAASMAGDSMGKFGKFMGGPYGLLLTAGISVLTVLISKHHAGAKSANEHKDAEETLTAYIHGEKIGTDALLTSLKQLNDERQRGLEFTDQAIRKEIDLVKATLATAQANRDVVATQLAQAKADVGTAMDKARHAVGRGQMELAAGNVSAAQGRVESLQSALDELDQSIGYAQGTIADDITKLARDLSTAVGRANDEFDKKQADLEAKYRGTPSYSKNDKGQVVTTLHGGLLNAAGMTDARRQQLLAEETKAENTLRIAREKAVAAARKLDDAEQGKTRHERTPSLGEDVDSARAASLLSTAEKYRGLGEHHDNGSLAALLGTVNLKLDPNMPAWCAAFVNAVLKANGLPGTGSLAARSFLNFGTSTDSPVKGDIVVSRRGTGNQGHVGFFDGVDAKGNIIVLGGNTSDKVATEHVAKRDVLGFRRVPTSVSSEFAADRGPEQQAAFDSERNRLNEMLLSALGKVTGDYQAQAQAALAQVDAEHKAEADKIKNAAAEGKYGDLTDKSVQAKVAGLQADNDLVQQQRRTNILVQQFNDRIEDEQKSADQAHEFRLDALNDMKENVRTSSERLQLELAIIAETYEYKRQLLERNRKIATENQKWDEVARINGQIADLPAEQARDTHNAYKANQSPMQAHNDALPKTLGEVEQKLQEIEATALNGLEDDLASATAKALGLKGAIGDVVAEIAKLGLQLLESYAAGNNPLAGLFGGKRAMGGAVNDNQFYLVGEQGPELFIPGGSGTIIPNHVLSAAASSWSVPKGLHAMPAGRGGSRSAGPAAIIQNWHVSTPNADSFRRSRGQMLRDERRRRG